MTTASPSSSSPVRVVVKPKRVRPLFAGHPWVFAQSIARVEGSPEPGDEVVVVSHEGAFVARGLFNPSSAIRVRLYRWDDAPLDAAFWRSRLESAVGLRRDVLKLDAEDAAYRLVFSEGDGLSGLTVDRYGRRLVVLFSSLALHRRRDVILAALRDLTGAEGLLARPDRAVAREEGLDASDVLIVGELSDGPETVVENGLSFQVDLLHGQKTGFYCDQRENRRAVARYCEGRRVLDLFSFTGGFALNAARHGGAASVLAVDSSAPALATARENARLNGVANVEFEQGDVPKVLERLHAAGERFDVVVCDPPKYAGHARDLAPALGAYARLNRAAVGVLAPGGLLATCSCSGLVDRSTFRDVLADVAGQARRPIQILEQRGQGPDHPVSAACPETDYLKCFVARVGA
ncbi:class I SAM-dependent rRNA methyltransferase [Planctomyces sp. SH-PL62]|uniref:class I SAM-dependent rRNA methyltransferase n=1 Tax=Planctomyces sp. SH-PL62 TaxID=1636152 RepID=UPI00078D392B|nr:class I SAM-dependent rRNA methyltransferase [Planctomyces sp. SH-PL62]AMV38022.1 Ribosomal RNA large subunit methyltransferase I [Planctomyces sp. SH-PL62]